MNFECTTRSNYFRVKDEDAFRAFMNTVSGDDLRVLEEHRDGQTLYGFGAFGCIDGVASDNEDSDEVDYDAFLSGLQSHVAEDDAIIIMQAGNEGLRYVVGVATVITTKDVQYINIDDWAVRKAREMLHSDSWETQLDY
jgi:hypothetical protein